MPLYYLPQKHGQLSRKLQDIDKQRNAAAILTQSIIKNSAASFLFTEVSIDFAANDDDIGGQIKPDHQHDDSADAPVRGSVRSKVADVVGETKRYKNPTSCRKNRSRQAADASQFFIRSNPVQAEENNKKNQNTDQPAEHIPNRYKFFLQPEISEQPAPYFFSEDRKNQRDQKYENHRERQ